MGKQHTPLPIFSSRYQCHYLISGLNIFLKKHTLASTTFSFQWVLAELQIHPSTPFQKHGHDPENKKWKGPHGTLWCPEDVSSPWADYGEAIHRRHHKGAVPVPPKWLPGVRGMPCRHPWPWYTAGHVTPRLGERAWRESFVCRNSRRMSACSENALFFCSLFLGWGVAGYGFWENGYHMG